MRHPYLACVAVASLTAGCSGGVPNTPAYPGTSAPANGRPGAAFCQSLEEPARNLQNAQYAGGWVFAGLAVGATGGGAIVDLVNTLESRRIAGTALMLGGVGLAAVAYHMFMRAEATGKLAGAANLGLAERTDWQAFETCGTAKAAWLANKSDPAAIAQEFVRRQELERRRLEDEIEQLKKAPPAPLPPPHP